MKTHVITLSKTFLKGHSQQGQSTYFRTKVLQGTKIHTLRTNVAYWQPKIEEVAAGKAILSIREWQGMPYRSKQEQITYLTQEDQVGFQIIDLDFYNTCLKIGPISYDCRIPMQQLAANDGLELLQFKEWFGLWAATQKRVTAICLHFTAFRYTPDEEYR